MTSRTPPSYDAQEVNRELRRVEDQLYIPELPPVPLAFTIRQQWPFSEALLVNGEAHWIPQYDTKLMAVAAQGPSELWGVLKMTAKGARHPLAELSVHHLTHVWPEPGLSESLGELRDGDVLTLTLSDPGASLVVVLFGLRSARVR